VSIVINFVNRPQKTLAKWRRIIEPRYLQHLIIIR